MIAGIVLIANTQEEVLEKHGANAIAVIASLLAIKAHCLRAKAAWFQWMSRADTVVLPRFRMTPSGIGRLNACA